MNIPIKKRKCTDQFDDGTGALLFERDYREWSALRKGSKEGAAESFTLGQVYYNELNKCENEI